MRCETRARPPQNKSILKTGRAPKEDSKNTSPENGPSASGTESIKGKRHLRKEEQCTPAKTRKQPMKNQRRTTTPYSERQPARQRRGATSEAQSGFQPLRYTKPGRRSAQPAIVRECVAGLTYRRAKGISHTTKEVKAHGPADARRMAKENKRTRARRAKEINTGTEIRQGNKGRKKGNEPGTGECNKACRRPWHDRSHQKQRTWGNGSHKLVERTGQQRKRRQRQIPIPENERGKKIGGKNGRHERGKLLYDPRVNQERGERCRRWGPAGAQGGEPGASRGERA